MTRIHCGALLDRPPGPKYTAALSFAELVLPSPFPRAQTFRRWKEGLDESVTLSLIVPREARVSARGPLRFDDAMESSLSGAIEAAEILGARFVVLRTEGDVTTGQRDRDLIRAWVARWPAERQVVWHPSGLWDADLAAPFARDMGVPLAFDPLEEEPPRGDLVYARMRAVGMRKRFSETLLLDVADKLMAADAEDAYVAIGSAKSFSEASRLAELTRPEQE